MIPSKVDLLLVTPPSRSSVYQGLASLAAIEPPVWSGLIARFIQSFTHFSVEILDAEADGLATKETAERIAAINPKLAAFSIYGHQPSASTQCLPGAGETAHFLDEIAPYIPTIAFGTHPSALPEQTLKEEPFTYVCQGDGIKTIRELLYALERRKNLANIPGLWRHNAAFGPLPVRNMIDEELDALLPEQAWVLLDMKKYRAHNWHLFGRGNSGGYASVQTSLGCPFKCSFCCINTPFGGAGIRYWSPKVVAGQIEDLVVRYGITNIKIPDEMFVLNRKHVMGICSEIEKRGLGSALNMWAYARIDTVKDEEMLTAMRNAGFSWLGIGIESSSKHVRDGVEKGKFGNEDIIKAIERVRGLGLYVGANYIFGLPDDTQESMAQTLELACELNTEWANFYCAMAYPGSPLHKLAREKKWRLPEDAPGPGWIGYSQHSFDSLPLRTETLSSEEILDFRDEAHMHYFSRPEYKNMMTQNFQGAVEEVDAMLALGKPKRRHRA